MRDVRNVAVAAISAIFGNRACYESGLISTTRSLQRRFSRSVIQQVTLQVHLSPGANFIFSALSAVIPKTIPIVFHRFSSLSLRLLILSSSCCSSHARRASVIPQPRFTVSLRRTPSGFEACTYVRAYVQRWRGFAYLAKRHLSGNIHPLPPRRLCRQRGTRLEVLPRTRERAIQQIEIARSLSLFLSLSSSPCCTVRIFRKETKRFTRAFDVDALEFEF